MYLSMEDCIRVMEAVFSARSLGAAFAPTRMIFEAARGAGHLALMPAQVLSPAALGFKAVTNFPGARDKGEPSHQAIVVLIDSETGRPLAVIDGTAITTIRTAAVSAVATAHLANPEAHVLAVLGTGVQAEAHLRSLPLVRNIDEVRIWGRDARQAERLTERYRASAAELTAATSADDAVRGADIIVTATAATEPIIDADWLSAGVHINAVGACVPTARELDTHTVERARVFVDDLKAAMAEAGDLLIPMQSGRFAEEQIVGELGDVVAGRVGGRRTASEITVFESLGLGFEDVAAARHVYEAHRVRSGLPAFH